MADATIRSATPEDAESVAEVYLASRKAFLSFAPLKHSDQAVRCWIADRLIPKGDVTGAEDADVGGVVGMMVLSHREGAGWIDHLYLPPISRRAAIRDAPPRTRQGHPPSTDPAVLVPGERGCATLL
jgi:hypothetical protein